MSNSAKNPEKSAPDPYGEPREQWQAIQKMSQQLQQKASQRAWEELLALQKERERALVHFFRHDIPADMAAGIAADVKTMIDSDKKIQEEIQAHQSSLMKESTHLKKLKQRSRSYQAMNKLSRF